MRNGITVLFLHADPSRTSARRELEDEMRAIGHAIHPDTQNAVALVADFAARARDLRSALLRHQPQVVHFAGYGESPFVISLDDERGQPQAPGGEALRELFGVARDSVRVVVLNGRDPLPAVEALSEVVDYAVGMDSPAGAGPALVFAGAFYTALARGRTVLTAFERGLGQLEMAGIPHAATPVRRIRRGVNLDATLLPESV
jgi:hypothetical protein